jgi:transposase
MSETPLPSPDLPGLETGPSLAPPPKARAPSRARVKPVDRSQKVWCAVDLEELIEEDHPARAIWELTGQLDLQCFYAPIEAVEGEAGRPPWDPRLLVSLWVYGYSRGISSAREIARRCEFDPGFQWLCGLETINYHTLSDFRVAHGKELQELFVELLGSLSAQGLVSLERVMHDGTKIRAYASSDTFRREAGLRAHLEAARQQVEGLTQEAGAEDESRRQRAARQRAARERLQRVEQALRELEQIRQTKHDAQEKAAARASLSEPEARIMKQADGGYGPNYNVQISTEASHKIIVGAGISQNSSDYGELMGGIARVQENCQAKPQQVVSDGGFTSRENILAVAAQGIDFIGSLGEQQAKGVSTLERQGVAPQFSTQAFNYDAIQDLYRCPAGQKLRPAGQWSGRPGVVQHLYRAEQAVCQACPFKAQCCPKAKDHGRAVTRMVEAPEVVRFREKMQTPQAQEIYRQRAPVAEFPNAWIKAKLGLRQFRLRGLAKVGLEVLWACLTYNIQQWIRLCWRPSLAGAQN